MKVKDTIKKPYGICPASMTIWNADQTYNKKGMEKYLTWLLDNGAQSISICGSTGENIAMNMEEQRGNHRTCIWFLRRSGSSGMRYRQIRYPEYHQDEQVRTGPRC